MSGWVSRRMGERVDIWQSLPHKRYVCGAPDGVGRGIRGLTVGHGHFPEGARTELFCGMLIYPKCLTGALHWISLPPPSSPPLRA